LASVSSLKVVVQVRVERDESLPDMVEDGLIKKDLVTEAELWGMTDPGCFS